MSNIISCLKERGLIDALTNEELITCVDKPIKLYCGFDPTADSLHIGNLVGIIILRWFQKFGHTPIVVLGGATGRIGDPSGKSVERPLLDSATIVYNTTRIRRHFEAILDFFHPQARPIIVNNDDWFSDFRLIEFLRDVGKHFRLSGMLAKESVKSRLNSEEGISFTEFTYQILQSYDFYYLFANHGVTLQIGGSDQWGNITEGVDLIRRMGKSGAYGLTFPLLTRSDGKKFGKSESGAIWLAADRCSPYDFYQYFYRMPDADVIKMMKVLTFMDLREIDEIDLQMREKNYIPNTAQKRLAEEMTRLVHGDDGLETARKVTQTAAPGTEASLDPESLRLIAKDMPYKAVSLSSVLDQKFVDLCVQVGFLSSKGESVRLIENNGAYLNNKRVDDVNMRITKACLIGGEFLMLGSGKKKKMLLKVE